MATSALNIPKSRNVVTVHAVNTTTDMVVPADAFTSPTIPGLEQLNLHTFAFLIENKSLGKTILFDCGSRKDWWNYSPSVKASVEDKIPGLDIKKNVNEILEEGGFDLGKIDKIVWSHWHWE